MQLIGMKADAAARLASAVATAENKLAPDQRKMFDGFEGMVKVEPAVGHDAHKAHAGHGESAKK
jgi:hypothetical protein